jgi:nicotinate-nucleotide pyrophosphorylase (carboxylating)
LNFLTHMCGIATQTKAYVDAITGTNAKILDTRKTLPGLRAFQKYAVTCGGGHNHRFGLDDAIMIKDNHIAAIGDITSALNQLCPHAPHTRVIEIEVDTLDQLQEVITFNSENSRGVDIVLLDNMPPDILRAAIGMINGTMTTEASGGVTLKTVRDIAETGVDYISIGALTHSVKNFDIGLDSDD